MGSQLVQCPACIWSILIYCKVNLRNKPQWNFHQKSNNFMLDNAFQRCVCRMIDSLHNSLNRYSPSIYINSTLQILPLLWYISRNIHMVLYVCDPMYFQWFQFVSLSKMSLSPVSYWYIACRHLDYCQLHEVVCSGQLLTILDERLANIRVYLGHDVGITA